ncbi:MAG: hypothetical protein RLZZ171_2601 [Cyanobacteriota bacterium]|jgi:hypothetical protein
MSEYKFSERSLEGTFIRCWDDSQKTWVNRNLKEVSDREFQRWITRLFKTHGLELKEKESSERTTHACRVSRQGVSSGDRFVWSVEQRTNICRWLFAQKLLFVLVAFLDPS